MVPAVGLADVKFLYSPENLDLAYEIIGRYDRNRDGIIDREEASRERWTHRNPFADDLNNDDRISLMELTQRYARRRSLDDLSDELRKKAWRTGGEVRRSDREGKDRGNEDWWRRGGSRTWLTATILGRFDRNRNGRLDAAEA